MAASMVPPAGLPPDAVTLLTGQMAEFTTMLSAMKGGKGRGKGAGKDGGKGRGAGKDGGKGKGKGDKGKQKATAVMPGSTLAGAPEPPVTQHCESFQVGRCSRESCKYVHTLNPGALARY